MTGEGAWLAPTTVDTFKFHTATAAAARLLLNRIRKARRRFRRKLLQSLLAATVRFRRIQVRVRAQVARPRLKWIIVAAFLSTVIGIVVAYLRRIIWHADSQQLVKNGTLPQLEIAIGAAMLGVIGIVFSLSIFSIQQVAERGTAYTVREYARDWVFRTVYWALAVFAFVEILSALQEKDAGTYGIWISLGVLLASVVVIKIYFDRAIKFVDPHFTISRVATRATKLLSRIRKVEGAVRAEVRYERGRRRR